MGWQRLTLVSGELAATGVEDFEPAIVDLIAMDHADVFRSGTEFHARTLYTVAKRRRSRHGTTVRELLGPGHPLAVLFGLLRHTVPGVAHLAKTGAAPVIIHFRTNGAIQKVLVNSTGRHDR